MKLYLKGGMGGSRNGRSRTDRTATLKTYSKKARRAAAKKEARGGKKGGARTVKSSSARSRNLYSWHQTWRWQMELHGDMYRNRNSPGFKIKWEVRKVLPFQAYGEAEILADGEANSYEAAGVALGAAMTQITKDLKMRCK